jgi:hypothetical protein
MNRYFQLDEVDIAWDWSAMIQYCKRNVDKEECPLHSVHKRSDCDTGVDDHRAHCKAWQDNRDEHDEAVVAVVAVRVVT